MGQLHYPDNFSHTVGRHSLKAGIEVRRSTMAAPLSNPIYFFNTLNDLLNAPYQVQVNPLFPPSLTCRLLRPASTSRTIFALHHLTLNLGLRWEYSPPTEKI
jgi:hypothetical protein